MTSRTLGAAGAKLPFGGEPLERPGNDYAPTVLIEATPRISSFREELFGPAAALIAMRDAEHPIELSSDSECAPGGNVWTRDIVKAERLAARIESGAMFINGAAADPRSPVGGSKNSSFERGRSHFGRREFCHPPTVWITS